MLVNRKKFKDIEEFGQLYGRGCTTAKPSNYSLARDRELLISRRIDSSIIKNIKINVIFTHLTFKKLGYITEEQRQQQIEVLNNAYNPASIAFDYNPNKVRHIDNKSWYYMDQGSKAERECKTQLSIDSTKNLNIYTGALSAGVFGWATFPSLLSGDPKMDGLVICQDVLPQGKQERFNLGMTIIHETGHWFGLYHTFQGGCDGLGDEVADTQKHIKPNYGTPPPNEQNGACNDNEFAPVHNFMNYVDDIWMKEFTPCQIQRIKEQILLYRKKIIK